VDERDLQQVQATQFTDEFTESRTKAARKSSPKRCREANHNSLASTYKAFERGPGTPVSSLGVVLALPLNTVSGPVAGFRFQPRWWVVVVPPLP